MPIVDIEIVGDTIDAPAASLAQGLADEAGRILLSPPATTWVRVRTLGRAGYAENGITVDTAALPVFVTVTRRQLPSRTQLAAEVTALTEVVARIVGRPAENVHIEYSTAAAGRMAFGGVLVD